MLEKLQRASRWVLPFLLLLTLAGAAMLYAGAPARLWNWFVVLYFILAAPMLSVALLRPFALWRDSKLPPQDAPDEFR